MRPRDRKVVVVGPHLRPETRVKLQRIIDEDTKSLGGEMYEVYVGEAPEDVMGIIVRIGILPLVDPSKDSQWHWDYMCDVKNLKDGERLMTWAECWLGRLRS